MSRIERCRSAFVAQVILLAVFLLPTAIWGQQVYGNIYGTAVDARGGALANANVSVTELSKNIVCFSLTLLLIQNRAQVVRAILVQECRDIKDLELEI